MERIREISNLFAETASSIAEKHYTDVRLATAITGNRPPFDELMQTLKELEKELTQNALKIVESYKNANGELSSQLMDSCHQVITSVIEDFVKKL